MAHPLKELSQSLCQTGKQNSSRATVERREGGKKTVGSRIQILIPQKEIHSKKVICQKVPKKTNTIHKDVMKK